MKSLLLALSLTLLAMPSHAKLSGPAIHTTQPVLWQSCLWGRTKTQEASFVCFDFDLTKLDSSPPPLMRSDLRHTDEVLHWTNQNLYRMVRELMKIVIHVTRTPMNYIGVFCVDYDQQTVWVRLTEANPSDETRSRYQLDKVSVCSLVTQ